MALCYGKTKGSVRGTRRGPRGQSERSGDGTPAYCDLRTQSMAGALGVHGWCGKKLQSEVVSSSKNNYHNPGRFQQLLATLQPVHNAQDPQHLPSLRRYRVDRLQS